MTTDQQTALDYLEQAEIDHPCDYDTIASIRDAVEGRDKLIAEVVRLQGVGQRYAEYADSLRAQLAAAQADTARLNWMLDHYASFSRGSVRYPENVRSATIKWRITDHGWLNNNPWSDGWQESTATMPTAASGDFATTRAEGDECARAAIDLAIAEHRAALDAARGEENGNA